jgi:hypothetical protein
MVYSADSPPDHRAALALQYLFGGRLRPVADVESHGVLGELLRRGGLAELLNEILA